MMQVLRTRLSCAHVSRGFCNIRRLSTAASSPSSVALPPPVKPEDNLPTYLNFCPELEPSKLSSFVPKTAFIKDACRFIAMVHVLTMFSHTDLLKTHTELKGAVESVLETTSQMLQRKLLLVLRAFDADESNSADVLEATLKDEVCNRMHEIESVFSRVASSFPDEKLEQKLQRDLEIFLLQQLLRWSARPGQRFTPTIMERIRNVGFGVGFQARAGETFRIQEFMEGAKLAYVRVNEMFNARDLQGLARVCTFKAKADLVVDVMREDVWNVKLISEIAKIGEPRVRSTRLFSAGDDMLFQIDVSMITTERQSLYDRITGLPMSDKGESNGFHTFHRCWTFEIEFDGTKNEPFHDGPYVWKFAGPAP